MILNRVDEMWQNDSIRVYQLNLTCCKRWMKYVQTGKLDGLDNHLIKGSSNAVSRDQSVTFNYSAGLNKQTAHQWSMVSKVCNDQKAYERLRFLAYPARRIYATCLTYFSV